MVAQRRLRWVLLVALSGCGEPDPATGGDSGAGDAGAGDAAPADAAPPDAAVFEVEPIACPPPVDDGPRRIDVQAPGSWLLAGCGDPGWLQVHFTAPPGTAWLMEATADAEQAPIVPEPARDNPLDVPVEVMGEVFFDPERPLVVTIRWIECADSERCGADRYCARPTYTCTDCADGDELFDTRQDPAPRTDAQPRALTDRRVAGEVCAGFDDWYAVQQPAGQPLRLVEQARVYVADPAAATLADLEPIPLVAPPVIDGFGVDVEPIETMVPPVEADRTVWVRLTSDAPRWRYRFEVGWCGSSAMCLPWWYCDRGDDGEVGDVCRACDGERDAHGDDDVLRSPEGAPILLAPGPALDGAVCGADEDWYAVTLGDPASRIEITGAIGFAYAEADLAGMEPGEGRLDAGWLESGSRIVLRSDMPDWYPDMAAPEVVWIRIVAGDELYDVPGTFAYTVRVEDGDFCAPDRFPCPEGRACEADSGRCVAAE